jgi:transposase-like protein
MATDKTAPATLLEAIKYFAARDLALTFVAKLQWPNGPVCPRCASASVAFLQTRKLWKCRRCQKQFSVKVGTIFEDSPIGLDKWLPAMWMICNWKGISSYGLARALGVTQKTAWFMLYRLRLAMQSRSFVRVRGHVADGRSSLERLADFTTRIVAVPKTDVADPLKKAQPKHA